MVRSRRLNSHKINIHPVPAHSTVHFFALFDVSAFHRIQSCYNLTSRLNRHKHTVGLFAQYAPADRLSSLCNLSPQWGLVLVCILNLRICKALAFQISTCSWSIDSAWNTITEILGAYATPPTWERFREYLCLFTYT